jgi:hypothetical protein
MFSVKEKKTCKKHMPLYDIVVEKFDALVFILKTWQIFEVLM